MKIPLDLRTYSANENGLTTQSRGIPSGELARQAGISPDTLRYYELRGLLPVPAKTEHGQRRYPEQALRRVKMVRAALAFGFTVQELGEILYQRDHGKPPCQEVYQLSVQKLAELEGRIRQMQSLRRVMRKTMVDWQNRLKVNGNKQRAGLLEALALAFPQLAVEGSPQLSPGLRRHIRTNRTKEKS